MSGCLEAALSSSPTFLASHPFSSSAFLLTNTSLAVTRCGITDGEPPAQISLKNLAFIVLHLRFEGRGAAAGAHPFILLQSTCATGKLECRTEGAYQMINGKRGKVEGHAIYLVEFTFRIVSLT